jgi:predicted DsbA family dithiol-disulfide isomerase
MVFVEKSVDDDRNAASRYGIRGTPTFVLIDAAGQEVTRFGFQRDEQSFVTAIESALARLA